MSDNNWPKYVPVFGAVSAYYGARYAQDYKQDMILLLENMETWRRCKNLTDLRAMKNEICDDSSYFRWALYNWIMRSQSSKIMKNDTRSQEIVESLKSWADWFDVKWRHGATHMKERRPAYLVRREWEHASRW
tara:strand:+ start:316 stop:714 length:399 start_codon:yes stop_codon:yes gene_type:complete